MNEQTLKVHVISPQQVIFDDKALSISSKNLAGDFDILPGHANFITLVENNPVIIEKTDGHILTLDVPFAVIYHTQDQVNIYVDLLTKVS